MPTRMNEIVDNQQLIAPRSKPPVNWIAYWALTHSATASAKEDATFIKEGLIRTYLSGG